MEQRPVDSHAASDHETSSKFRGRGTRRRWVQGCAQSTVTRSPLRSGLQGWGLLGEEEEWGTFRSLGRGRAVVSQKHRAIRFYVVMEEVQGLDGGERERQREQRRRRASEVVDGSAGGALEGSWMHGHAGRTKRAFDADPDAADVTISRRCVWVGPCETTNPLQRPPPNAR
jgi:hypothetical protein